MLPGVYSERCGGVGSVFMRCAGASQVAQLLRTISRRSDPESHSASTASAAGDGSLFTRQGGRGKVMEVMVWTIIPKKHTQKKMSTKVHYINII